MRRDEKGPRGLRNARLSRRIRQLPAGRNEVTCVLHELFEARADESPDWPAVVRGGAVASYLDLERQANRVARFLRGRGVRRGSRVVMLLDSSIAAYGAILGALKAGAAYVPLDPRRSRDDLARLIEASDAAALVTTSGGIDARALGFRGPIVFLDVDGKSIAFETCDRLPRESESISPDDLCHVTYDSDTAGEPKGVMVEHRSAWHIALVAGREFGLRPWDRVYQSSPLHEAAAAMQMWLAFQVGATLVAPAGGVGDAAGAMARARVTVLPCTPSRLASLDGDVPSVRLVIVGCRTCPGDLVARWTRVDRRLVRTYGQPETSFMATYADLNPSRPATLGHPLPGCRVRLLDARQQPARRGETGEICVGGPGVSRGYLGLPAETVDRFVPDPFAAGHCGDTHLFRTGDLGRIDPDGNLEYCGVAARPRSDARLIQGPLWFLRRPQGPEESQ